MFSGSSPIREGCARTCRVLLNTTVFEQSRRNFKRAEMLFAYFQAHLKFG